MGSCSDTNILPNLEPLWGKQVGLNYTRFKGKGQYLKGEKMPVLSQSVRIFQNQGFELSEFY